MVGVFEGHNGTHETAVLVIDTGSYTHLGSKSIAKLHNILTWAKRSEQITYKELLEW